MENKEQKYKHDYYLCHASRKQLISLINDYERQLNIKNKEMDNLKNWLIFYKKMIDNHFERNK